MAKENSKLKFSWRKVLAFSLCASCCVKDVRGKTVECCEERTRNRSLVGLRHYLQGFRNKGPWKTKDQREEKTHFTKQEATRVAAENGQRVYYEVELETGASDNTDEQLKDSNIERQTSEASLTSIELHEKMTRIETLRMETEDAKAELQKSRDERSSFVAFEEILQGSDCGIYTSDRICYIFERLTDTLSEQ